MGRDLTSLIGTKLENAEVIGFGFAKRSVSQWEILCNCGDLTYATKKQILGSKDKKPIYGCKSCAMKKAGRNRKGDETSLIGTKLRGGGEVIGFSHRDEYRTPYWLCKCHCNKLFIECKSNIIGAKKGRLPRYGCNDCANKPRGKRKDMIGKRFGRLVVLEECGCYKSGAIIYKCKCDCNNFTNVLGTSLRKSLTKSCGCLKKEVNRIQFTGSNHPNWIHDHKEREKRKERCSGTEWEKLKKQIWERDNYICKKCKKRGGRLTAHHLNGFHWCKERRCDINNLCTLCFGCHENFHRKYGKKYNTINQFNEWVSA